MKIVFVNHCHPDCPHVCGTRAREFARALTRRGHQIVLLTESLRRDDPTLDPGLLPGLLAAHDWSKPFQLPVRPRAAPVLEALRGGRLPAPLRALTIAYQYGLRGGMFTDWRDASRVYWKPLADTFRPDIVWGIFGNSDAWAIARGVADLAGCPWVRDIKDLWTGFIPPPLRRLLAWRYTDAVATTALSRSLIDDAAPWFDPAGQVVYSGISADVLAVPASRRKAGAAFTLVVVGGTYKSALLSTLVDGLERFVASESRGPLRLIYVGTDVEVMRHAAGKSKSITVETLGLLPWKEYWKLVSEADLNLYLRAPGSAWHHKIVELLAAGRPILCMPGEIEEGRQLARRARGVLHEAGDAAAVAAVLESQWRNRHEVPPQADRGFLTWDAQAEILESVLRSAAGK